MRKSFLAVILFPPCIVLGQTALSLQSALDMARRSHPLLQAGDGRVAAARGVVTQAALRPNPRLFLQTENWRAWSNPSLTPSDSTDTYAYITQPFETAGKRSLRTTLAQAGAQRSALERELIEKQVVARVKNAYWAAATAVRVKQVLEESVANFQQIVHYHEVRVREGAVAEADLLRVRLEGDRLSLSANSASLEAERARIDLFRAMGQASFPDVRLSDPLDAPPPVPPDLDRALAERTELKIVRQVREEALANLRLQRAAARPDIDALLGYKRTAGFNTVLAGLQLNLPFSNRNQGAIESAEAVIRVSDSEIAATEAVIRAEVQAAGREVQVRSAQVSGTFPNLIAQAGESSRIAQAAYREGGADLLRLLDAERVRIELEALYYRTLGEYHQSLAALETAMGANQ